MTDEHAQPLDLGPFLDFIETATQHQLKTTEQSVNMLSKMLFLAERLQIQQIEIARLQALHSDVEQMLNKMDAVAQRHVSKLNTLRERLSNVTQIVDNSTAATESALATPRGSVQFNFKPQRKPKKESDAYVASLLSIDAPIITTENPDAPNEAKFDWHEISKSIAEVNSTPR